VPPVDGEEHEAANRYQISPNLVPISDSAPATDAALSAVVATEGKMDAHTLGLVVLSVLAVGGLAVGFAVPAIAQQMDAVARKVNSATAGESSPDGAGEPVVNSAYPFSDAL
jgi:hypothetical protein